MEPVTAIAFEVEGRSSVAINPSLEPQAPLSSGDWRSARRATRRYVDVRRDRTLKPTKEPRP